MPGTEQIAKGLQTLTGKEGAFGRLEKPDLKCRLCPSMDSCLKPVHAPGCYDGGYRTDFEPSNLCLILNVKTGSCVRPSRSDMPLAVVLAQRNANCQRQYRRCGFVDSSVLAALAGHRIDLALVERPSPSSDVKSEPLVEDHAQRDANATPSPASTALNMPGCGRDQTLPPRRNLVDRCGFGFSCSNLYRADLNLIAAFSICDIHLCILLIDLSGSESWTERSGSYSAHWCSRSLPAFARAGTG